MTTIDLNCDLGESYGNFIVGKDDHVFPLITSCNVACGFHGGDPLGIEKTLEKAMAYGVQIGAHPSYPDLMGFGRRRMHIDKEELRALVKYQVAALVGMAESLGAKVAYVKPHGALYNAIVDDEKEALAVLRGIVEIDDSLPVMGLAGSKVEEITSAHGIPFVAEAFADRRYNSSGRLMGRHEPASVILDPQLAAQQALDIVLNGYVETLWQEKVAIKAQSICIHGDNPVAVEILLAIHELFASREIGIIPFSLPVP